MGMWRDRVHWMHFNLDHLSRGAITVEIKPIQNASRSSDRNPTASVLMHFYNVCDVASSDASDCDPTGTT